jgi:integral membrane protein
MTSDPRRLLNAVLVVGVTDFLLLLVLLYFAWIADDDGVVSILGPIHGIGFLALLYLTYRGALERFWPWWFPAMVLVTGGPVGSLIGELVLRRRIRPVSEAT